MAKKKAPEYEGTLRSFMLKVPEVINTCTGIKIFGKTIRSILFSTDVSIIRNTNADAVIAVYPFTPQPVITQAVMTAADIPVFAGVGGGLTQGKRVLNLALHAEHQGAIGVVLNAPTKNETIKEVAEHIDIPVVITVVSEEEDIAARLEAGAKILNVSGAANTPNIIRKIRKKFPDVAIMATGGPNEETIQETIKAGANAITWTPPTNGEIFKSIMDAYRKGLPHP
ncbi:MAG TPA: hydrolase [Clostridiales bacterium]|nr:hydrolase [Clostridiales bacterium]